MSLDPVKQALETLCSRKRIVLWDDSAGDWSATFREALPPGVTGIAVDGESLRVKHRVLREEKTQRFVLYFGPGPRVPKESDMLYDLRMTYGPEFLADKESVWLIETGLNETHKPIIAQHTQYFADETLRSRLKATLTNEDKDDDVRIRLRMIAVLLRNDTAELRDLLPAIFKAFAEDAINGVKAIESHGLGPFLWEQIRRRYGYAATQPTWKDFVVGLMDAVDAPLPTQGATVNHRGARELISSWRNHAEYRDSYVTLAQRLANELQIKETYAAIDTPEQLLSLEAYREADVRLLSIYGDRLLAENPPLADIRAAIETRLKKFWARYDDRIEHLWNALSHATHLTAALIKPDLTIASPEDGFEKYSRHLWKTDLHYRKFIHHLEAAGQGQGPLAIQLGGRYVHDFLKPLARHWQPHLERLLTGGPHTLPVQRDFFKKFVMPLPAKKQKVCVIISDALRYEIAEELRERLNAENRWVVQSVCPMLGVIPSYTQAGMASLLPHSSLAFSEKFDGTVLADGQSTMGTTARSNILAAALDGKALAISAEDFKSLHTHTAGRELAKANTVIYVYQNGIDKTGDDRQSEGKVFQAAESTLAEILEILRKAAAMNFTHMVVTSDHGFLYQHQELADTNFIPGDIEASKLTRRFALGATLPPAEGAMRLTASQLGFQGPGEVVIPKCDLRFRQSGSGSRYVHGGATLQEIIVPALQIRKERQDTLVKTEVELIGATSQRRITTGQITLSLFQSSPVDEECSARTLRMVFKAMNGCVLSETHTECFNSKDPDDKRRERKVTFHFNSESNNHSGKSIRLHLEEPVEGTTKYTTYAEETFDFRRSIAGDFDL